MDGYYRSVFTSSRFMEFFMKFLFTESGLEELLHIFPHLLTFSIMIEQRLQWQEKDMPDSLLS
jgi:hypothetical protein